MLTRNVGNLLLLGCKRARLLRGRRGGVLATGEDYRERKGRGEGECSTHNDQHIKGTAWGRRLSAAGPDCGAFFEESGGPLGLIGGAAEAAEDSGFEVDSGFEPQFAALFDSLQTA